ncbi:MAG: hypothetical protein HFH84_12500 [Lachnospiraceae bacterium]|nr:hypothetical protein [Lachnospiraceae bacterium]
MQLYQQEYIANLKEIVMLTTGERREKLSFEAYLEQSDRKRRRGEELVKRNMKLLREGLFPVLDHIYAADETEISELREFAGELTGGKEDLDGGLYCQIHKALLSLARMRKDRKEMIRELYCLGMGYYGLYNKLVGLERKEIQKYTSQMRLCFAEAAAYLKYFDEIEDTETRGFILRSRANMSLGQFNTPGEKIRMVKRTLEILQDKGFQEKEPGLPWDRYIFLTHQQMAASISYGRESTMTSRDVEDVMESVYIVYQRRFEEAAQRKQKMLLRPSFSYYVIEYFCGMFGIDGLLARMETLMDGADAADFSEEGMYGIISLPAFYSQYLNDYPDKIPGRAEYVRNLYRRAMEYVEAFPREEESEKLFLYLRQLPSTFVEVEGGILYKQFLLKILMRFAPEIYVHSKVVADAAVVFCRLIIDEEPDFFDDMDSIREIGEPLEKRQAILDYARECGMLHDVGKINFMNLYSQTARQWFEEEYEMAHLHTNVGAAWLGERESTSMYAPVALGHHCWYDGSHGYPETYHRLECPCRQMVDIIGMLDWINNVVDTATMYTGVEKSFREAVDAAIDLERRRFSPLLTARLRDKAIAEQMEKAFAEGRREAYRLLYESM